MTVREAIDANGFYEDVIREAAYLPVCVSSGEHLDVEVAMSVNILPHKVCKAVAEIVRIILAYQQPLLSL